jgi:hypothetical protein
MTRRTKHILVLISWIASFFLVGIGVWSFQAGHLFLFLFLMASALVYGFYAFFARCPDCGMPLLIKRMRIFGMDVYRWMLLTPERCGHCGTIIN